MKYYALNEHGEPVEVHGLIEWARMSEKQDFRVALDKLSDCEVSTVFLGFDHNFTRTGPPVLWETRVFGGPLDQEMDRCPGAKEQAEAMHQRMLQRVKEASK